MEKVSMREIELWVDRINKILLESNMQIEVGHRYDYYAIDLADSYGNTQRTLKTGLSKKEVGLWLDGFEDAVEWLEHVMTKDLW